MPNKMKILVLQGSPRTNGHTAIRVAAFVEGAGSAAVSDAALEELRAFGRSL